VLGLFCLIFRSCAALIYIWVILLGPALKSSAALGPEFKKAYIGSAVYFSFLWTLHPIAWGLCGGANVIDTSVVSGSQAEPDYHKRRSGFVETGSGRNDQFGKTR
jgi:hypothetical protein